MAYLEELLPEFRKGARIRMNNWPKYFYYEMRNGEVYNQGGHRVENFSYQALFENVWEIYQEPEPDWQYIIDHKCLCWFWDDDTDIYTLGILTKISNVTDQLEDFKYKWNINGKYWKNYRPVRRDEVTFYEDKKDD